MSLVATDAAVDVVGSVRRVLERHRYILGPEVEAFERRFADFCGVAHAIGVANGTDALELALRAIEVGAGDRVALVANAGSYGSAAVHAIGATPDYVEIDPATLTMSPEALREALARRPSAVIVTHLYGQLANMSSIATAAAAAGVPVIEDCAQAHGAMRHGRRAGTFGTLGCFSFYPTKNLGAIGDGGAIVTGDDRLVGRLRQLRQYGWETRYRVARTGGRNSRLDEIQAAILLDKLPRLDGWNTERREIARRYVDGFAGLPLRLPASTDADYVAHLFVVRLHARDALREHLERDGIGTDVHYPVPDHLQPAGTRRAPRVSLPHTEDAAATVVTLPCYPGLTVERQGRVIRSVRRFLGEPGD